jgi:hypothetical protein
MVKQVIARGAKPCPGGEICLQRLTGRWLQGNQPLLAELAVADDQAILDQIVALQSEGLGNPETCRRQQAEQIMVRVWADRVLGRKSNAAVMIARTCSGSMMVGVGRGRLPRPKTPAGGTS